MRTIWVRQSIVLVLLLCAFLAVSAAFRAEGRPRAGAVPPRADASSVAVDADDIGGVVTSSQWARSRRLGDRGAGELANEICQDRRHR